MMLILRFLYFRLGRPLVGTCCLGFFLSPVFAANSNFNGAASLNNSSGKKELQFTQSSPLSAPAELSQRFGIRSAAPAYDVATEKFRIIVPPGDFTNSELGLFVWISPGDRPGVPNDWPQVLAQHRLLFIGAYQSGNSRHLLDRFRLALDAVFNLQPRFKINPDRVYVSGFSGGGRVASMLGVACSDIFRGAIPICGVDFYMPVPAVPGQFFPASYIPQARHVAFAKTNSPFILITGESDPNRLNTQSLFKGGFKKQGFKQVQYLEVPEMGHAIPSGAWLDRALTALDTRPGINRKAPP